MRWAPTPGDLRIVLGLGNPGSRYEGTRHNVGSAAVDQIAVRAGVTWSETLGTAWTARADRAGGPVVLAKPRLFMNLAGLSAAALTEEFGVDPRSLVVVVDDADLEFGRLRIRPSGSCAGHNGVRSIAEALGTSEFVRVRLGVRGAGRLEGQLAEYVLARFEDHESGGAAALVEAGADAVEFLLLHGVVAAMNEFNGRRLAAVPREC